MSLILTINTQKEIIYFHHVNYMTTPYIFYPLIMSPWGGGYEIEKNVLMDDGRRTTSDAQRRTQD